MASMYEDIEKYRSPMSVQKTALEPIDTAYLKAKAELDETNSERDHAIMFKPMSTEEMKRRDNLYEICAQYNRTHGFNMGTATVDRDDIAVAADRETEM